jgi:hypothetical protein
MEAPYPVSVQSFRHNPEHPPHRKAWQLKKIERTDGKATRFKLLMVPEERARNIDPNGVKYKAFVTIVC